MSDVASLWLVAPLSALVGAQAALAIALMTLLLAKHFIFDFPLQFGWHVANKGYYGRMGGVAHATGHGVGTGTALLLLDVDPLLTAMIAGAEVVLHYHIDWIKEQIVRAAGWTPKDHLFWVAIGLDQFLHNATYVAITITVLTYAPV